MNDQTMNPDHSCSHAEAIGALDEILGLHIRRAHGAVYRHFAETFGYLDLTQKQVSVLWLVGDHPGIAQTDLARRLEMDRATVMGIVNRLQARGFLVRGRSSKDGRRQTLDLLAAGVGALDEARSAIRAHEAWLKARFTEQEVSLLTSLLKRIYAHGE